MSNKRRGLSKPLLTAFFYYNGNSLTLSKLKKFVGKHFKFYKPNRIVRQLKPFIERGIIVLRISDKQAYDKMLSVLNDDELFKDAWSESKNLVIYINQHKLIELSPEKRSVKAEALKLLRNNATLSVATAINIAKKHVKKK
jgi:hypothetical protein